jgi:tetratricopeptide (TPR) repeat protein
LAFVASGLDAHPVVRQHFGRRLKEDAPDAFREANRRLCEHYKALPEKLYGKELPDTLEEMQPLFAAIAHGCAAELHQEVFDEVYYSRVQRDGEQNYAVNQLGAVNADLGALAHFFDPPWGRPHPSLAAPAQAVVLNFAGFRLRALGRLREAVEPMREYVEVTKKEENWEHAAVAASNLSELLLTLGDVGPAVAAAREGVTYADQPMINLSTLADALHEAGDRGEAEAQFVEAERLQKERQPELPRLYSLPGYRFCDLRLGQGRHAEVAERAAYSIEIARRNQWLLDTALDNISLGRAAHQASWAAKGESTAARRHLDAAVEGLRKAGTEEFIVSGLLARAAFRRDTGEWDKAQEDLAETYEIASRGGMRLFLTDYYLERARLLLIQLPQPAVQRGWFGRTKTIPPTLTAQHRTMLQDAEQAWKEANDLIQTTGYHRRDGELAKLRIQLDTRAA